MRTRQTHTTLPALAAALAVVLAALGIGAVGCGKTNPNEGKPCSTTNDCGSATDEYCYHSPGGGIICKRDLWCIGGTCRLDCTGSCFVCSGCGYLGSADTIDCSGMSSDCSGGEKCAQLTNQFFVCAPQ